MKNINLKKINFMSQDKFDEISDTDNDKLYLVKTGKICEVVFPSVAKSQVYSQNLPSPLPDDLSKVFCNVYARIKTATTYYAVGDIIPFSSFWGGNYRPLGAWFNQTQCGFNTSDQMAVNNKTQSNTGTDIAGNVEVHFDFYLME